MQERFNLIVLIFLFCANGHSQEAEIVKDWTAYSQSVDVSKYENKEFRVSAYLRKEGDINKGKSALWARIDKKNGTVGFFKNDVYNKNLMVSNDWKIFTISGKIDKGAGKLYFGAFCQGNGAFYFDDFNIEIKSNTGEWESLKIGNKSFEETLSEDSWQEGIRKSKMSKVKNFEIIYSKNQPFHGQQSLLIKGSGIIGNNDHGKFVEVNNVKLYYETYGEGQPLLLLHGNGQSISAFINQVEEFSKLYKVILVDCRGRGNSSFDYETELTYTLEAKDIKLFLDKIGVKKTHILGWSDGGIIGLIMAINFPEKISKLIAVGANINPKGLIGLEEMKNTIEELEKNNRGNDNDLFISLYKLMANYPKLQYEDLKAIKSKTLIMAGDHDEIKNIHTIKMYEAIDDAQLAILPNETHYFPSENPKFFNKLVLDFLKE
ncbi:alpha/beta hydrolase [Aquimarina sp. D1M17]|uniref:alpha/beta fold hydrolase n=1 Tax=Aquimarina acroporae TaxID=2937283 RepID=UPI0020BF5AD9|nr:alpha/beta hydrolase [Aquimarina acroporae]MCK8522968.1 alpha/beta hydrolase [Aquimarina acroporae]